MNILKEIGLSLWWLMAMLGLVGTPVAVFGLLESLAGNKPIKEDLQIIAFSFSLLVLTIAIFLFFDL
jgi:hypothetical protein